MGKYVDIDAVIAELERRKKKNVLNEGAFEEDIDILCLLKTLEVKNTELDKFKSLQHLSGDLKSTLQDWGYAPNLYHFDGSWHVDWISCEEGDSIKGFTGDTAEEAINKAYNWFHSTFCNS
jgi:hypothetical protein